MSAEQDEAAVERSRTRVRLSDGSTWPAPPLDTPEGGLAWRLTYTEPTRSDLLLAASICNAYAYLLTETTAKRRALIVRELRAALTTRSTR